MTENKKNISKWIAIRNIAMGFMSLLCILVLLIPAPIKANAAEDFETKEGSYVFSTDTVTRYWADIYLSGKAGNLVNLQYITATQKFSFFRADYKLPVIVRFDNVKYKDKPIIVLGEVLVNMPGTGSIFSKEVKFKSDLHINLFPSAYNYMQLYDCTKIKMTFYANGKGIEVAGTFTANIKFDKGEFDSSIDDPNSGNFDLEGVTDGQYNPDIKEKDGERTPSPTVTEVTGWQKILNFLANIFGTTIDTVETVLIIGVAVIAGLVGVKFVRFIMG